MSSPRSLKQWLDILSDNFLSPGMDAATLEAAFFYLVDLGLFVDSGEGNWALQCKISSTESFPDCLEKEFERLCREPKGIPLAYLLVKGKEWMTDLDPSTSPTPSSVEKSIPPKTSDLSNLQIVNKYGRQVQSFMELEQKYMGLLLGPATDKKCARKLFNFILSQIKEKAEPRPWEQLSRRRHR